MQHLCDDYIHMLKTRCKMLELIHRYICSHDEAAYFDDVDKHTLSQIRSKIASLKSVIGNDPADEIIECLDSLVGQMQAIQEIRHSH